MVKAIGDTKEVKSTVSVFKKSRPCYWEQHGETTRDQHETEYIYSSECVVLTLSALDVPEKEISERARLVGAERCLGEAGSWFGALKDWECSNM